MSLIKNVRFTGKGEQTLVLSHGYGASQSVWDNVVTELSQKYRILLFDWNFSGSDNVEDDDGHGGKVIMDERLSSKYSSFYAFSDELTALMDEKEISGAVYAGHSMACMIGCLASIKRPELFNQLVLIAGSPRYLNSEDYQGGFERMDVENMFLNMEFDYMAWAESFVALAVGVDDPVSVEKVGRSFKSMRPEVAVAVAKTIFLSDMRSVLGEVTAPCTIIQVRNDFAVPVTVGSYMKSKIKGKASLVIMDSDGHFPQLTVPAMLLDILDREILVTKEN